MEKVYVVHSIYDRSQTYDLKTNSFGRMIYILYSDGTWEEIWIGFNNYLLIDEVFKVVKLNVITQKKMDRENVHKYINECREILMNKEVEKGRWFPN